MKLKSVDTGRCWKRLASGDCLSRVIATESTEILEGQIIEYRGHCEQRVAISQFMSADLEIASLPKGILQGTAFLVYNLKVTSALQGAMTK